VHKGQLARSQLIPGDVLITITGRIGTSAVVPENLTQCNINQHIVRIRLNEYKIDPYFLAAFLNSFAGLFQSERESYGTTREALPYYCLEKLLIPIANTSLQKRVRAKILEAQDAQKEAKKILDDAKRRVEEMILKGE
jgi:restriction endonuclease S subunit